MLRYLALTLLVGIAACSSSAGPNTDVDAASGIDAAEEPQGAVAYCESISEFFCDFYLRCGRTTASTKEACVASFEETCNANFEGAYVELEALGFLSLSTEGIEVCREHLATVACEQQINELQGPCSAMWLGAQSAGDSCGLDTEFFVCDSQSDCILEVSLCGECRPLRELGEDCEPGVDSCGSEAHCLEGSCVARKQAGELCADDDRCVLPSRCEEGTCVAPSFVALGEDCDSRKRCPYSSACLGGTCVATANLGDACGVTTPCEAGYCEGGLCREPQSVGEDCENGSWCQSGLCTDSRCAPRPSACLQ